MTWVNVGGAVSGGSTVTSPYASEAELAAVRIPLATGSTTARSLADRFADVVNVKDFGAKGDGVTDDTAAIQATITAALTLPSRGNIIDLPSAKYRITSPLNFTGGTGDTPIIVRGRGWNYDGNAGGTVILGQTGGWMMDLTGAQWITFEDLVLQGTGTNASGGGILLARAAVGVQYAHGIDMRRVTISIDSKPAFSSVGSIALANVDAEVGTYDHCWFRSDTPHVLLYNNELGLVSPYQTIGGPLSTTDVVYRSCQFQATTGPGMYLFGAGNVDFSDCYWSKTDGSGNATTYAITLRPGTNTNASSHHLHAIRISGQVELFSGAVSVEDPAIYGLDLDIKMPSPALPYMTLQQATSLYDARVRVQHFPDPNQNGTASTGHPVLTPAIGASTMYGGSVDLFPGTPNDSVSNSTGLTLLGTTVRGHGVNVIGVAATVNAASQFRAEGPDGQFIIADVLVQKTLTTSGAFHPSTPAGATQTAAIYMGAAAPVAGTFGVGDRVINNAPAVGQPKAWACTVAGTPGTWVSEGNL